MRIDQKFLDVMYMARDFYGILRGTEYFHFPDRLGSYFVDGFGYYVDFTNKSTWSKGFKDGVPTVWVPSLSGEVIFPTMVLQYGLGCIDRYGISKSSEFQRKVEDVVLWLHKNHNGDFSFNGLSRELNSNSSTDYYSNNNAMTQGHALSFLVRARTVVSRSEYVKDIDELMPRIYTNMVSSVQAGGTTLYSGEDVIFCEYCRKDGYVVLNGWIFALFGIIDYQNYSKDQSRNEFLDRSIQSLERHLPRYVLSNGWSMYDNIGRLSSPTYQQTHITITDALYRLTAKKVFLEAHKKMLSGFTWQSKAGYMGRKIVQKLRDPYRYVTSR